VRFLRVNETGGPTFTVGTVSSTLPKDPGARIAIVTAFSLAPERAQVQHLVSVAALIGVGAVLLAVIIAIWLGTLLTRPIRRLADRARHLGQDSATEPALRSRFRDVDDVARALHESAASLNASIDELRRREGHARRLVSDVAHELRTPLTSMIAVSEILDDFADADPEDRDVAIGITRRGTDRLSALVNEVLELSRMDAGVRRVEPAPTDLSELLQDVVDLSAPGADITLECPPGAVLQTDPSLLRKIVSNLVTNAVRHGNAPVSVVATAGEVVRVRVADAGTGIAAADADRVFDRFTMLDGGRQDRDSTGIGLAIAREASRLLGGDLVLESSAPTTFLLTLPRTLPERQQTST
jgi:two-component system sensor histidine kinase MtrB